MEGDGNIYALSCDHVMKRAQKSEIIHPARDDYLAPVVQTLDSAIHRINHNPADKY